MELPRMKRPQLYLILALCASLPAMSRGPQPQRPVSFPRTVPAQEHSSVDRPEWIDANELLTPSGEFRRPEDKDRWPLVADMIWRLERARDEGSYTGGPDCFEDGIAVMGGWSSAPPRPVNMPHLEILAESIIHGKIVGMKTGFFRGRAVGLYEIEIIDVLKGRGVANGWSSVFLLWPETKLEFGNDCVQWSYGSWDVPAPEVGREILLTPVEGVLETIADRPAIVAWYGAEAIYETEVGLGARLSQMEFPDVFSTTSIRDLEIVRRLRAQRR